jgi:hypothetical protein
MVGGAAVLDATGGVFCFAAARELAGWMSVPRGAVYVTGALFLVAAGTGVATLRREPVKTAAIVAVNEVFAVWCVVMLAADAPNRLGSVLLLLATLSSAGTGALEALASRRG